MKKQILTVALGFVTVVSFGQKNELKAAEKAIKKQDFTTAVSAINSAEPLMANAEKLKSKFYFLKGKAFAGKKEYRTAAAAFNKLLAYEKAANKFKYSDKAAPILNHLIQEVSKKAISFYGNDDFKNATENFYLTYALSPTDTSFLYNAAISSAQAKDFDTSLEYYRKLKEIGYSGIKITYLALNPKTGKEEDLGSKAQRDLMVRSGSYGNPVDKKSKSKSATIIKNIAGILSEQGKYEEAVTAIKEARKATPGDINLLLTEADFYIKLKKMDEFGALMAEAVKMDPNNAVLYFNLGVVNYNQKRLEEAKGYYKKAIELKADYSDAYMNLAVLILDEDVKIVEEMNKNLSNFKKYDELEKRQKKVYREALPYLEKSDSLKRNVDTVRTLLNIYENLEMEDKAKVFRELYKSMR